MKKAENTHADNAAAFIKWLFGQPESVRNRILEEIYPGGIKDTVSDIPLYYLLNCRLPSFVPAIIKYVAETKGITLRISTAGSQKL